jgi:hypothetical protein
MSVARFTDKSQTHLDAFNSWDGIDPFFRNFFRNMVERIDELRRADYSSAIQENLMLTLSSIVQTLDGRICSLNHALELDDADQLQEMRDRFEKLTIDHELLKQLLGTRSYNLVTYNLKKMFPANSDSNWGLYLFYKTAMVRNYFDIGPNALARVEQYFQNLYPDVDINRW